MTGWSMTDILSEIVTRAGNKPRPVLTKCDKVGETFRAALCGAPLVTAAEWR
jgi:hypothetical protein